MSLFIECEIEKPPKNIKTRWLLVMNQLMYLRKPDIFFAGFSNPIYSGTISNSFLLDIDENLFDPLGIDFRRNAKYGEYRKQFLRVATQKKINIDLFNNCNFRNYMNLGRVLWPL